MSIPKIRWQQISNLARTAHKKSSDVNRSSGTGNAISERNQHEDSFQAARENSTTLTEYYMRDCPHGTRPWSTSRHGNSWLISPVFIVTQSSKHMATMKVLVFFTTLFVTHITLSGAQYAQNYDISRIHFVAGHPQVSYT
jgi:hypothetical protein